MCGAHRNPEHIGRIQDKRQMLFAAQKIGMGCPATYMLHDGEDLDAIAPEPAVPGGAKAEAFLAATRWRMVFRRCAVCTQCGRFKREILPSRMPKFPIR